MGFGDSFLIGPGTLFLFVLIAAVGIGLFTWASKGVQSSSQTSLERQEKAITCSNFDLEFVDRRSNKTHYTVFLQPSQNAKAILVYFKGRSGNRSSVLKNPAAGEVSSVSVPMTNVTEVFAYVKGCNRRFG